MKELSLALFIACASGLCWAITADLAVSNGGGFSFSPNSGSHFEPALFDAGWGRCRAFGGWSDENGDADGPWTRAFEIVGMSFAAMPRPANPWRTSLGSFPLPRTLRGRNSASHGRFLASSMPPTPRRERSSLAARRWSCRRNTALRTWATQHATRWRSPLRLVCPFA